MLLRGFSMLGMRRDELGVGMEEELGVGMGKQLGVGMGEG